MGPKMGTFPYRGGRKSVRAHSGGARRFPSCGGKEKERVGRCSD